MYRVMVEPLIVKQFSTYPHHPFPTLSDNAIKAIAIVGRVTFPGPLSLGPFVWCHSGSSVVAFPSNGKLVQTL